MEAQAQETYKVNKIHVMHVIIGLCIMFSGYFLSPFSIQAPLDDKLAAMNLPVVDGMAQIVVTPIGMIVVMTFFGVIYLWTFADTLWPGIVGIAALFFSGYAPAPKILGLFLGNPMVAMIFFIMIFAAAIIHTGLASWIARFLMTRDFLSGRPWLFTATLMITGYVVAFFDQVTSIFLMWPVLYSVLDYCGYKKGDKYVSVMVVYVCIMALLSFASDPFKGGAFYLLANMQNLAANQGTQELDILAYFIFSLSVSLVSIAVLLAMLKFVFRVDVTPLKKIDATILRKDGPLPPMSTAQKVVLFTFLGYAIWLLLPSIIGTDNVVGKFLKVNSMGGAIMAVLAISVIFIKGKPAVDITVSNVHYPLRVFFLIAVAFLLGGAMTAKETNVAVLMEYMLKNSLAGLDYTFLIIVVSALGILLTNFCNSVVLGIMVTPILLAVAGAFGVNPGPIMACFIYAVLIAACTPAASPFAATLFGQTKWADTTVIVRYAVICSVVVLLIDLVVGIPIAKALF